ncbi:MAG: hypothetical protein PHP37_00110 [Patescibacteria group bacterium]|nr:hypothetical protein [Patescibacteria group bacterium]
MNIKNLYFDNCFLASGSLNFFGDGWWYDFWYKAFVPGFKIIERTTFVAKTTTLYERAGNMPLNENFQPREIIPKCIKAYPLKGAMLNAVGLSGPGANALFERGKWQQIDRPFFISFMAVNDDPDQRLKETTDFLFLLLGYLEQFKTNIGLQINISCPNTKHNTKDLANEALKILKLVSGLKIPIDLKVNTLINTEVVREIERSGLCDVLTLSNTIPYGTEGINWKNVLGRKESPLQHLGGGGLSGKVILPLVLNKIKDLRSAGITMPIKGSGGIFSANDVDKMKMAGANAIEIGTVLILRPWRVKAIIDRANEIF